MHYVRLSNSYKFSKDGRCCKLFLKAEIVKNSGSHSMNDIELASHLMRRAGFGLRHEELIELVKNPYELIVNINFKI